MKALKTGFLFALLFAGILLVNCTAPVAEEIIDDSKISVAFTSLTADGNSTAATTKLTLTFDNDIGGLTASDITFTAGTTGATKGALTTAAGKGIYNLAVSGITAQGSVSVTAVAKSGYTISGMPKSATVYPAPAEPPVDPPVDTPVTTIAGFVVPSTAKATSLASGYQGKSTVYKIEPNPTYGWAILTYDLSAYAGKEITITITSDVWLEAALAGTNQRINWQVNNDGYPTVAQSSAKPSAGQWISVSGNKTVTPESGKSLYLSSDGTYGLGTSAKAYITNLSVTIVESGSSASNDIMALPPLKNQFADYFMIGNIFNPADANNASGINNTKLTRHYAILTPENNMKPSYLSTGATTVNTNNMNTAVRMISAANASGMKVVGHTLLWHSQNATWMNSLSADKNTAITAMKNYITTIMGYTGIKGKIYSWDVLNEIFPDDAGKSGDTWQNSMRTADRGGQGANPWYVAIGSDFVYEGYLAARQADPTAILYYNDYNLDNANKARMVRDMVEAVNNQYKAAYPSETRKLIEGIGMQSHHNINVTKAQIKATLELFKPLGVKISISELDVLSQSYGDYSPDRKPPTEEGKAKAADLYGEYFALFLEYADIIERVTFWGVYDRQSWRYQGLPLIFEGDPATSTNPTTVKAKPAYYKVIEALE